MIVEKNDNKNHIMEILLPFFCVMEVYSVFNIPVTAILLVIILVFRNRGNVKLSIPKSVYPFLTLIVYMVLRDVIHMFLAVSDPINIQINRLLEDVVMYILIFLVCNGEFNEDVLFKWWKVAGTIFGVGMLYHVFVLFVLGQTIQPISLVPGYSIAAEGVIQYYRPTSFFNEPASYVSAMMPLLFLSLKRKNIKWSVVSTLLIILSTSTIGIVLTVILWGAFFFFEKKKQRTTMVYIVLAICCVVVFMRATVFSSGLQKLLTVLEGGSTWSSRVAGPFEMVKVMQWYELPFGTNILDTREFVYRNIDSFTSSVGPLTYVRKGYSVFMNSIAHMIFRYGILGLFLFLRTFKDKVFNERFGARIYAIMLFGAAFAQGSIVSPSIPLILMLLYANEMEKKIISIECVEMKI